MSSTRFHYVVAVRMNSFIAHICEDVAHYEATRRLICIVITQRELQMISCLTSRLPLSS